MFVEKKVLLSIKPIYAEKILIGEKKWELRKSAPAVFNRLTVFMYATRPIGQIVGMFSCDRIVRMDKWDFWYSYWDMTGVSDIEFLEYYANCSHVTAWKVGEVHRFEQPFKLEDLGMGMPPLSWCFF